MSRRRSSGTDWSGSGVGRLVAVAPLGLPTATLAHGAGQPSPVPHWVVLLVAVPGLWLLISGLVVGLDRLLARLGW